MRIKFTIFLLVIGVATFSLACHNAKKKNTREKVTTEKKTYKTNIYQNTNKAISIDNLSDSHPNIKNSTKLINVKHFGAVGNGKADDTKSIQRAISACSEEGVIIIEKGMNCKVSSLKLKSNISFTCNGTISQISPKNLELFGKPLQNSSAPLLLCNGIKNVIIEVNLDSKYEGIFLSHCTNITIKNSALNGNHNPSGFAGIMMYVCKDINVYNSTIFNYGKQRISVTKSQAGSGIRALQVNNLLILKNRLHNNGDNGIFTITSRRVKIDNNIIHNNGLSGIQIAFDATQQEYDYQITNNKIFDNMADGIDVNNGEFETKDIKLVIKRNILRSNGYVNKMRTSDGSGIATLIKVSNVIAENNTSSRSNRSSFYLRDCGKIMLKKNISDKPVEIVNKYESLTLSNNRFPSIDLIGETAGNMLKIIGNTISNISLPNGTKAFHLIIQGNKINACNINFNVIGKISFTKNVTHNSLVKGVNSIFISKVTDGLLIQDNVINQTSNADCISITSAVPNIKLINNDVTGINSLITDVGAPDLIVTNNKLVSLNGGYIGARTYVGTPNNAHFSHNTHNSQANNIRVTSGQMTIDNDKFEKGYNEYGNAKIKVFQKK